MLLGETVFSKSLDPFTGIFIDIILIRLFDLAIKICTVIITDGRISIDDFVAHLIEVGDVVIIMLFHDVHETQDMLVVKRR